MNIYDVSKHAGVSIATVSRVLNGNPNVSEKTRNKVMNVMAELGYTPNVFARGLGLNTMQTIGIMCSDSSDPYLANAIYYLERALRSFEYDAILCCTGYDLDAKQKYFNLLRSKRVDAIILAGSKFVEMRPKDNSYLIEAAKDLPLMLVNGYLEGENIYSTLCDDHAAMHHAATGLLKSGRRRILYLYTSYSFSGVNKMEGYKDAYRDFGLPLNESLICQCAKDISVARDTLLGLHGQGLEFDAVITSDDSLAVGAVKYAHEAGISIPDQLSVIGYNNSLLSRCTDPEITSIDSKVEALCTTTINTLMGVFSGMNVPSRTTIASDLIKRQTTNF
ncbi:LacI family DNA-binding transcriptional regulator [Enterocloster asparagiformis]|uniref:Sugar-binding domain protein n=2 Tax=Enterocloster asparagiformis TaxID=333367 RepID=C0D8N2_9FIRM|nr:LacI family DNA-binding transcriptional regulator [Enterocloster asparagiformis]EEG52317.1 sugar-binding domain protein [[Clostridium] asparagiforme DSM 15981]RGX31332.1 LacI family transcriptional regulator [Enterocloster asparagiformis]UWO74643.1 LacI family transcriptional regulator [[Clostridium] asparagiforme DSM 15981]